MAQRRVEPRPGASLGLVAQPPVFHEVLAASAPALHRALAPGAVGQPGGDAFQRRDPLVVADGMAGEVFGGRFQARAVARAAIGVKIVPARLAHRRAGPAELRETPADIALAAQRAFDDQRTPPQRLPTQRQVAVVVDGRPLELAAGDLDLGVVEKPLLLPTVEPARARGLAQHPLAEAPVEFLERPGAVGAQRPQPLAERGLVGHLPESEQVEQGAVLAEGLDIRQAPSPRAVAEEHRCDIHLRVEAVGLVTAGIERGVVGNLVEQTRGAQHSEHGQLAAVDRTRRGGPQFDPELAGFEGMMPRHAAQTALTAFTRSPWVSRPCFSASCQRVARSSLSMGFPPALMLARMRAKRKARNSFDLAAGTLANLSACLRASASVFPAAMASSYCLAQVMGQRLMIRLSKRGTSWPKRRPP